VKQIRKRLTYANVMSSIAVFLILGGGAAFAAAKLGKNTVGTKQLKNNAVTTAKIKKGAVTGAKVNLGSLGKVPSAANADNATNATNAGNANTVGGMTVSKIAYAATNGSAPQVVLNTQGLILTATCTSFSPTITATTNVPEGVGVELNSNATTSSGTNANLVDDGTGGIFTTGDVLAESRDRGSFVFQTSQGHVVSGVFDADNSPALHNKGGIGQANCAFGATINAG
jgi:hypothetical protein